MDPEFYGYRGKCEKIAACNPPLPPGCRNRKGENWRVLFQIAHVIGGHFANGEYEGPIERVQEW